MVASVSNSLFHKKKENKITHHVPFSLSSVPPIGVVRIHIISGKKLKNVDRLGGKSDPYVRAMSGLQPRAQTEFVMDDLDPQWDEVLYVPVHSMREDLLLEVMDWNSDGKMKLIGMTDLFLKDLIREEKKGNDQSIYNGLPAVSRSAEIVDKDRRGGRGVLNYEAQFFATLALAKKKTKETDAASNKSGEKEEKKDGAATEESDKKAESSPISSPVGLQEQDSLSEEEETPLTDLHGETILYTADNQIDYNAYEAGVISVTIHQVTLPSRGKAVAEILVDSNDPQFRTSEVKGVSLNFNESGDAFVKEMDFSRLVVRVLNAKDDDRIGYWSSSVRDIVKSILENPEKPEGEEKEESGREYNLLGCTGGKIRLSFSFFPVIKFTLDPSESLESK